MRFVSGWRLALRLAWREAWRSKARAVLVLVMVTFPVVAVIAADVAQATQSVSSVESLDRRIGSAEVKVESVPGSGAVYQAADPDSAWGANGSNRHAPATTLAQIQQVIGGSRPATELRTREAVVRTDAGILRVDATGVDMASPLAKGLFRLTAGRYPRAADEVAINRALADEGFRLGGRLTLANGTAATVVGIAESTGLRTVPELLGVPDYFPDAGTRGIRSWLLGGEPVTWDQVRALNELGVLALSREVVQHPPSTDQLAPQLGTGGSDNSSTYAVLILVGVMALIEVVLLAGPAFAVGARRQSRSLALIAANGGTPTQSRRVILGTAVVIGAFASVVGIVLGIALGRGLVPVLQSMADTWFGPFQIRWDHVLGIAAFGLLSSFLAAVVPAWIASRQDVVAVLAGRRGDRKASRRSPVIGVVLTAAGIVVAVLGARRGSGETMIAGAAVLSIFGMIFLVPLVVVGVARLGRRFPLPLRYAVRDAARHRTRTVPAVAAVAATVAGVVALSIANTSDQAQAKADYVQELPVGMGVVTDAGRRPDFLTAAKARLDAAGISSTALDGVPRLRGHQVRDPGVRGPARRIYGGTTATFGVETVVADRLPALLPEEIGDAQRAAADAVLAKGGVVLFSQQHSSLDRATIVVRGTDGKRHQVTLPTTILDTGKGYGPASMVLSPEAASRLDLTVAPTALLFDASRADPDTIDQLRQTIGALDPRNGYVYVEPGYQVSNAEKVVLWILFGLAGVLMLGGTLTATFLALSDARPDLATLSAVGASPRTRRAVAAAYAVSIGVVGAALGAAVGFIPGVAVTYPLTRPYNPGDPGPTHYLVIPWLEIGGLVVLLPLVTALVVGLLARSRLPLVARLD
jgi:putative ABC transport system permease protein